MRARATWIAAVATTSTLILAATAHAQSSVWTASAGHDTFGFRDVSRTTRPVDASPITWRGTGAFAFVRYDRAARPRIHRIDFFFSRAGQFKYVSPLRATNAVESDRSSYLAARYSYLRFPWRDVAIRGLDLGGGVEGGFSVLSFRQEFAPSLAVQQTRSGGTAAGVLAARLTRWRAVTLDTTWSNGLEIARRTVDHSAASGTRAGSGGGWTGEWVAGVRARLSQSLSLAVDYRRAQEIFYAEHAANAVSRRSVLAGVTYAR